MVNLSLLKNNSILITKILSLSLLKDDSILVTKLLSEIGATFTGSEGRRIIRSGGLKINDVTINDEKHIITSDGIKHCGSDFIISIGHKKHSFIVFK